MKDYLSNLPYAKLSIYATVIVIFTYNVLLERDMDCTCKQQTSNCGLYMTLPFFIIFVLILWMDKKFQRIWKYSCTCCCKCKFIWVMVNHIVKAVLVGLLWVVSVYLDGDWYVCCENDKQWSELACKDKSNITAEEKIAIAELKNCSKIIGLSVLSGIILLAALMPWLKWKLCWERNSSCCDRDILYEKLILEEEENVLEEILRKSAKEKLTKKLESKINGEKWKECFDIAEEVLNDLANPGHSTQEQQAQSGDMQLEAQSGAMQLEAQSGAMQLEAQSGAMQLEAQSGAMQLEVLTDDTEATSLLPEAGDERVSYNEVTAEIQ